MPHNRPQRKEKKVVRKYSAKELNWKAAPEPYYTLAEGLDPLCRTGPAQSGWKGPSPMAFSPPVRKVKAGLMQIEKNRPKKLFRFFKERKHAEDLVAGRVWLSTLKTCRNYEDPEQGDSKEGHLGECKINDALVLCTTLEFRPENFSDAIGRFCVEITDPFEFFILVSNELLLRYPIARYRQAAVIYADRELDGDERQGRIGFVKPPHLYAKQQEHRMLWTVEVDTPLTPGRVLVPGVKHLCKLHAYDD